MSHRRPQVQWDVQDQSTDNKSTPQAHLTVITNQSRTKLDSPPFQEGCFRYPPFSLPMKSPSANLQSPFQPFLRLFLCLLPKAEVRLPMGKAQTHPVQTSN